MSDTIDRQAVIAVADSTDYVGLSVEDVKKVTDEVVKGLKCLPSAQPEQPQLDGTETTVEILSELRSRFNCFDICEEPFYRVLSEAIKAVSAQPEQPEIVRCKDCKYADTFREFDEPEMPMKCLGQHYGGTYPDDFCIYNTEWFRNFAREWNDVRRMFGLNIDNELRIV